MTRNGLDETYEPDYFNSHPHEEDDDMSKHCRRPIWYFNSHPHEEDDSGAMILFPFLTSFQLTSSRGGWLQWIHFLSYFWVFQLTSSRGGWQFLNGCRIRPSVISTHILTRRMTNKVVEYLKVAVFQLTSSRGGWRIGNRISIGYWYFNSHPHEEDDLHQNWHRSSQ